MIETKAAFSRRLGVNKSTVTRMAKAGRLVLTESGKVKVEESLAQINATQGDRTDVAERHAQNRGHSINTQQTQPQAQQSATVLDESDDMQAISAEIGEDRAMYKAIALDAKNQQDKLDDALANGSRLYSEEFLQDLSKQAGDIKAAIERLIDNLAPQLTGLDEQQRKEKIETEINLLIQQPS